MEYLSEQEKVAIEKFVADSVMHEAVRKVLLSGIYFDGRLVPGAPADSLKNFMLAAFTNAQSSLMTLEDKGKKLEAIINAISMVETGFKELEKVKHSIPGVEVKEPVNRGR